MTDALFETPPLIDSTPPVSGGPDAGAVLAPAEAGAATQQCQSPRVGRAAMTAAPASTFDLVVHGQPAPQGSKRGYVVNGRAVMVESSKKVKPWREAVKHAALDKLDGDVIDRNGPLFTGPLMVTVVYTLPRPKGHYRTGRNAHLLRETAPRWPAGKPDGDKLDRACLDALTDAGVWGDDAQVCVRLSVKSYPDVHPKALTTPGAYIRVTTLPADVEESA